jgi:hypothetical protein
MVKLVKGLLTVDILEAAAGVSELIGVLGSSA